MYRSKFELMPGSPPRNSDAPTLIALNSHRFRGELEVLIKNDFRIIKAPYDLQTRLLGLFFETGDDVLAAAQSPTLMVRRQNLRTALRGILAPVYAELGVDATIGAALHYKQDLDWGATSQSLGYPYIILHRENLAASQSVIDLYEMRAKQIDPFAGGLIGFHNEIMRKIFVDSGYVPPDRAAVTGAMRMDNLIARLPCAPPPPGPQRVTLFSFGPGAGIIDSSPPNWPKERQNYLWELCVETHVAVLEFARDNPNVEVIVKPKWGGSWIDNLLQLYAERGLDPSDVPNFTIIAEADVQALIETSHVVIGFASTTLLEAAIMGRPVIVPWFAEAVKEEWQSRLLFRQDRDIFDCANSPAELKTLIGGRLNNPVIDPPVAERRRQVFAKYVAPLDGSAAARTAEAFRTLIDTSRKDRHRAATTQPLGSQRAA